MNSEAQSLACNIACFSWIQQIFRDPDVSDVLLGVYEMTGVQDCSVAVYYQFYIMFMLVV